MYGIAEVKGVEEMYKELKELNSDRVKWVKIIKYSDKSLDRRRLGSSIVRDMGKKEAVNCKSWARALYKELKELSSDIRLGSSIIGDMGKKETVNCRSWRGQELVQRTERIELWYSQMSSNHQKKRQKSW